MWNLCSRVSGPLSSRPIISTVCCSFALLFGVTTGLHAQETSEPALKASIAQSNLSGFFDFNRTLPVVSNGTYISFTRTGTASDTVAFSDDHQATKTFPFTLPGASRLDLQDAAITASGTIVLAGTYATTAGLHKNFLAEISQTGRVLSTQDLAAYTPERVCTAANGDIWSLGQEFALENTRTNYNLLHHYTITGALKNSYLSRSTVIAKHNTTTHPVDFHNHDISASPAFLQCSSSIVGAYLGVGPTWTEVSMESGAVHQWAVAHAPGTWVESVALANPDSVYASVVDRSSGHPSMNIYHLVKESPSAAHWALVPASKGKRLLGFDNGQLVYKSVGSKVIERSLP